MPAVGCTRRENSPDPAVSNQAASVRSSGRHIDDLIDFTPELHAEAVKFVSRYKIGPIFTPAVVSKPEGPIAHA